MFKTLPVIFLWDDVVFPFTFKEIEIKDSCGIGACRLAVEKHESMVIVVPIKNPSIDEISFENITEIGVVCRLSLVDEMDDKGEVSLMVKLEGLHRVKIKSLSNYKKAKYAWEAEYRLVKSIATNKERIIIEVDSDIKYLEEMKKMRRRYKRLLQDSKWDLEQAIDKVVSDFPKEHDGVFDFKKCILCEPNLVKRLRTLLSVELGDLFDISIKKRRENEKGDAEESIDENISRKVTRNINKQQKEFYLREKLRVIKEELGDASSKEVEIKKIRACLDSGHFPKHILDKAREELQRFEMCSSYSNEATVIRSYLDWLLNLPWMYVSKDEMDLKKVQKILNANHYGLEKIKDRIIEFLSVKKKSSKETGTIICFVGPPGVGKTSLVQSIAEALNKKFVKISLGGLYDESELRGHRRTYVASMPGKIIRGLRQAKVKNPVFLLDEIDKISSGYHGDPVHALLEILDPKQNSKFNDHYMEEDFDLSKVMFIATANYEDNIPDPLWDRMEMIHLRTYTEKEKLNIAIKHLVPEILKEVGLNEGELSFTDEALTFIIQRYTREAGVRNLKKQIEKVARKVVKEIVVDGGSVSTVTPVEVKKYLEYELFDITKKDDENIPGIVNGMAYTEFGGDLLPIEVNHVSGKGNLSLTGNLRDTMKESANVALAYVRANEDRFGLKDKEVDWNNIDVNLHVPTGGTPKDGPSAGVTITTALISSFSGKPVSSRVAMTGEITLRGKVLPIGGLREKIVSAVRGGIDTIFYPEENSRNLVDVPEEVRDKIKLIPVKDYTDIYNFLFSK